MSIEKCTEQNDVEKDLLGFSPIANSVANYISSYKQKDTLTISIEGEWGSGKSSMVNFITNEVKLKNDDIRIIRFNPWMIMEVDTLIEYFFSELFHEILFLSKGAKYDQMRKDFKKIASIIMPNKVSVGVSSTKISYDLFSKNDNETLYQIRQKISSYMSNIDTKIMIIVDDIDRLTDKETEVFFRLIKAVADFDNLIYILIFDKNIVSKSLEKFKDEKGEKYLDKIIDYSLHVPKALESTLQNQFINGIKDVVDVDESNPKWTLFMGCFNIYITNLRDVKRLLNFIRMEYPLVKNYLDSIDFILITLIKIQNIELYNYIKNNQYLFIESIGNTHLGNVDRYKKNVDTDFEGLSFSKYRNLIEIIFPVFNVDNNLGNFSKQHFISSFLYFDSYFSLNKPINDIKLQEFINTMTLMVKKSCVESTAALFKFDYNNDIHDFFNLFDKTINRDDFSKIYKFKSLTIAFCLYHCYNHKLKYSFNGVDNYKLLIRLKNSISVLISNSSIDEVNRFIRYNEGDPSLKIIYTAFALKLHDSFPNANITEFKKSFSTIFTEFKDPKYITELNFNINELQNSLLEIKKSTFIPYIKYESKKIYQLINVFKTIDYSDESYTIRINKNLLYQYIKEDEVEKYIKENKVSNEQEQNILNLYNEIICT